MKQDVIISTRNHVHFGKKSVCVFQEGFNKKAVVQIIAVKIAIDHLLDIVPPESVLTLRLDFSILFIIFMVSTLTVQTRCRRSITFSL
jgi:hypothetical protein